jgi:hypothetical protein
MDIGLAIDVTVIALLAATIFYAFKLERRLAHVRNTQVAFADVIRELNTAAVRAEAGIRALREAAASSGQTLDDKVKRARGLADELDLLLRAGERFGQRIDTAPPQTVAARAPSRAVQSLRALGGVR